MSIDEEQFPISPIPEGNLSASPVRESYVEANAFKGMNWKEVARDFAHRYRDAVFWFTPNAFHYYLPAFMAATLYGKGMDELFAGSIVRLLRFDEDLGFRKFRKERWSLLADGQCAELLRWLIFLRNTVDDESIYTEDLEAAIETVKARAWESW